MTSSPSSKEALYLEYSTGNHPPSPDKPQHSLKSINVLPGNSPNKNLICVHNYGDPNRVHIRREEQRERLGNLCYCHRGRRHSLLDSAVYCGLELPMVSYYIGKLAEMLAEMLKD